MTCTECGTELLPNANYCHACGEPVDPRAGTGRLETAEGAEAKEDPSSSSNMPWIIAGAALVALLVVVLVPRFSEEREPNPLAPNTQPPAGAMGAVATPGDPAGIDLSSMTPREAADRLWDRVLRSLATGDTAQSATFLPMALGAYQRVDSLGTDGHYRVAVLLLAAGDVVSAREHADSVLAESPSHLLGLFVRAQAAQIEGRPGEAESYFRQYLENYEAEAAQPQKYAPHQEFLPIMRQEAEARLDAG